MYLYDCNAILTAAKKNRSDKKIIRAFTSLTEDLKSRGINPGFYFMDNTASTYLNMTMTSINSNYQLVPTSNHREHNTEITIQTLKNHFIEGMCIIEKYLHLQLWGRLLHQEKSS